MTPEQAAFDAALKQRLAERGALLLSTETAVIAQVQAARAQILEQLAAQPSDFALWRLPQLLAQIDAVLDGALGRAAASTDAGLRGAWQAGEDFIDKPLAAGGFNIEAQLPLLDASVLQQLRGFATLRFKDVATEAATKISRHLGLVTLGAQSPFEAIKAVQALLGNDTPRRATTIVRTEVSRAFALASDQRLTQAAAKVPGLQKQWRRSGKLHSRPTHDAMDGQVVDAGKAFKVPSQEGGFNAMQHPHDPTAPAAQNINCGCLALPYKASWAMATPGAKPFTELELTLDPRKARLGQAAQRAGRVAKAPAGVPHTVADFIRAGRRITDTLPDGALDAPACHKALLALLEKEVGMATPCQVKSAGAGAKLVREASQRYPNTWTAAADAFGPLQARASATTRGYHYTETRALDQMGLSLPLPGFGQLHNVQAGTGFLEVRAGDVGNAVHEYAHRLQKSLPALDDLFQQLHRQRTGTDPLKKLKDLEPSRGYAPHELTREDHYTTPYQGREYTGGAAGGAREVMTMGMEAVLGFGTGDTPSMVVERAKMFRKMYRDDRPMFDFVVGLLRYWRP